MSKTKVKVPRETEEAALPPRVDPAPRPIDPSADFTKLRNVDPSQHYVLVNTAHEVNRAKYRALGYKPVSSEPSGVQPAYEDVPEGETIEVMGQTLMSMDKERYDLMQQAGQEQMDGIMRRINSQQTIEADVRPTVLNGKKILDVKNETQEGI